MIRHMFIFGVIIPTLITIVFFVAFLVCWFKFNIKDRLFNKHFFKKKKQLQQGVSPKMADKAPASVVYKHDSNDNQGRDNPSGTRGKKDPGDPDDPGGGGPPPGSLGYTNDAMSHSRPCSGCPEDRDNISQCSMVDSEADLCPHKQDPANYFLNPDLTEGDSCGEPGQRLLGGVSRGTQDKVANLACRRCGHKGSLGTEGDTRQFGEHDPSHEDLIQQTFHFPVSESDQLNCLVMDLTEDESGEEDSNYGHFIPRSEVEAANAMKDLEKGCVLKENPPSRIYTGGSSHIPAPTAAGPQRYLHLQLKQWQDLRHKKLASQHAVAGVQLDKHAALSHAYKCSAESCVTRPNLTCVPMEEQRLVT